MKDQWNANLYDQNHSFVNEMAGGLVTLLDPKPGESILDLGCGTGPLTQKISEFGTTVIGVDASPAMIAKAKQSYPLLSFQVKDALTMIFDEPFDAIFSNAALHWVKPPERAIAQMFKALKPRGRLVLEMGGFGNVETISTAAIDVGHAMEIDLTAAVDINYFPTIGQYTALLEKAGFVTNYAVLFDRPTPLADGQAGLINWIKMFRPGVLELLPIHQHEKFEAMLASRCKAKLLNDGIWRADYRRLRISASR